MNEVVREYGGMLVAAAGTIAMFGILCSMLWSADGLLVRLIESWCMGEIL